MPLIPILASLPVLADLQPACVAPTLLPVLRRVILLTFIVFLIHAQWAAAHVVSQIFTEYHQTGNSCRLDILFDAAFADPATRNDPSSPQPSRDWLVALPAAEQKALTAEARKYLESIITLESSGHRLGYELEFPDFQSSPPDFPELLNDGAYFRIRLQLLKDITGELSIHMAAGAHPDLIVKLPGSGEATYLTLSPGGKTILKKAGSPAQGRHPVAVAFVQGVLHVVPRGTDHILFVLGMFLLSRRWRPLLSQSFAFTAAHTITLGLAAAGLVSLPSDIVEPIIALSITALALENLLVREAGPWRLCLVFAFGLIHGLGFASVLSTWIKPGRGFVPTLLAANIGVETGQLAVIVAAWILTIRWHESPAWPHARRWACIMLALAGLWWFAERVGLLRSVGA
jgi:hypothetical protein